MDEFFKVARVSDIQPGQRKAFWAGGIRVLVLNIDGTFYAVDDSCPHMECSLFNGSLSGKVITCPCHDAQLDVETGAVIVAPTKALEHALELTGPLPVHPIKVEGNDILVGVPLEIV
jgi:3-phenylpropionate/trans-cinnamate dioxygenase ferredoxin subunit